MTIRKQYLKSKPICKVTFKITPEAGGSARTATVVGDFNNWSSTANPMKRLKNGAFTATIDLETGKQYQFRYLLDKTKWENDGQSDRYAPTPYGDSENSVVIV
jgi:1,4-alpha-glucan branching enzyme